MTEAATLAGPDAESPPYKAGPRASRARVLGSLPLVALALALALLGQGMLAERVLPWDGAILLALALLLWLRALKLSSPSEVEPTGWSAVGAAPAPVLASPPHFAIALGFAILAWLLLEPQSFTRGGSVAWLASLAFLAHAIAPLKPPRLVLLQQALLRLGAEGLQLRLSLRQLLLVGVLLLAMFFRFYELPQVPAEMTSDHVEKLLDVRDVLLGKAPLFFPRNTGREPLEFYVAAVSAKAVGLRHFTLQLVTITCSLAAVVATYFLGKELLGTHYGLLAAALMAVARWDITLARTGLRFSLTTLFVALTLLFLFRALRTGRPSQYLLCGLSLGAGLLGYSNFRVVPLLVLVLWLLALVLHGGLGSRRWREAVGGLCVLVAAAALVVLPLARFVSGHSQIFWSRALSRIGTTERALPGDPATIFLGNLKDALLMFNWRGDVGWVHNVNLAPALDQVTAAFFALGVGYLVVRLVRSREFWVTALLVSIVVLMLPSALTVAFPIENPSFNRASGAIPVVVLVAALTPAMLWSVVRHALPARPGALMGLSVLLVLLGLATVKNVDLYFGEFAQNYRRSVPNSSEIAAVAAGYADALGGRERVFILSYPHWVDHRAVGLHMGDITWDNVLMRPEQVVEQRRLEGGKVYLVHLEDTRGLGILRQVYPRGQLLQHRSSVPGKDFLLYLVFDGEHAR